VTPARSPPRRSATSTVTAWPVTSSSCPTRTASAIGSAGCAMTATATWRCGPRDGSSAGGTVSPPPSTRPTPRRLRWSAACSPSCWPTARAAASTSAWTSRGSCPATGSRTTCGGSSSCAGCPSSTVGRCSSGATSSTPAPRPCAGSRTGSRSATGGTRRGGCGRCAARPTRRRDGHGGPVRARRAGRPSSAGGTTPSPTSARAPTAPAPAAARGCSSPTGATGATCSTCP